MVELVDDEADHYKNYRPRSRPEKEVGSMCAEVAGGHNKNPSVARILLTLDDP